MKPSELLLGLDDLSSIKGTNKCVVKLTTSYWHTADGCHMRRELRFLRRQCLGYNILYEDCCNIDAKEVITKIVNLNGCEDGIYEVVTCNESASWETPNILDDYDYKLIPYKVK